MMCYPEVYLIVPIVNLIRICSIPKENTLTTKISYLKSGDIRWRMQNGYKQNLKNKD